jgi:hypothetical protein
MADQDLRPAHGISKVLAIAPIAFVCFLGASSARADPPSGVGMAQVCRTVPCIYDAQNQLVGVAAPQQGQPFNPAVPNTPGTEVGVVMRKIGGAWYQLNFFNDGPDDNAVLYFEGANCTGQPLIRTDDSNFLPPYARWDGSAFWAAAGTHASMLPPSFSYQGRCFVNGGRSQFFPAVKLDVPPFNPPFKMQ